MKAILRATVTRAGSGRSPFASSPAYPRPEGFAADNPEYPRLEIEGARELVVWGVVTYAIRRVR